jgi:glycosyltransferase involved in cell wall biosynthesis
VILSAQLPPVAYRHPWNIGFEDRLRMLCSKNRHVLYFYEHPDTSTFRYRVFNMVESLNAAPDLDISASWFSLVDSERMDKFIDRADVLVLCRARYGPSVDRILSRARLGKIPVFFDIDDLVFNSDFVALIIDSLDQDSSVEKIWDNWFAYTGRYGTTLKSCDAAITTNHFLADRIADYAPRLKPHVIPNFLNRSQQERSDVIWDAKLKSDFKHDDNITIGYFSGTPTHNRDFQVAIDGIAEIMDNDPRIILRVVGFLNTDGSMLRHRERIEFFPLQDFLNLQGLIGGAEINIAPLQNNTFTNCKSELKYFEAAIVGTLTVASPTFTFSNSMRDGESGFLASAQQWREKIEVGCQMIFDNDKYTSMAKRAHDQAISSYGWDRFAGKIASVLFGS